MRGKTIALAFLSAVFAMSAAAQTKSVTSTTLAVTSAGNTVTTVASGSVVTLTATVEAGSTPVTPGQVNFCDATAKSCTDIHLLGTAQLTSAGTAVLKFRPGVGSHSYEAVFVGTNSNGASSSSPSSLTVTGALSPSTTTIQQSGIPSDYTLTATVTGAGLLPPTGNVSFLDTSNANAVLWTEPLGGGQTTLSLLNPQSPATAIGSESIVVGDFNGDGIPDLVAGGPSTNDSTPAVSLMLGNGDGTFTTSALFPSQLIYASSIAVGDFNGDGKADLAVLGYESLYILLGNGDGTFNISTPYGYGSGFVAVGDFNGDGIQDLAMLCQTDSHNILYILLGNDDGTFTPVATSLTLGEDIGSIAVGDFNGDGKADLAITNQIDNTTTYGGSSVSIFLGKGDGTFTAAPTIENPPVQPRSVVIGDFNGDGIQDLAVSGYSTQIFLGNGDGTFQPSTTLYASGSSITVGDFNGDGKADLAMVWPDDYTAYVYFGNGDGTFTQGPSHATGEFPWALTAGDFNGDGAADLAVTNAMASTVTVLTSQLTQTSTATASGVAIAGQGMHLVNAKYPGDGNFGSSTSGTTELTAGLPTPSINWATPAAITYGTALSGIQLNASSPVAGTFTYSPAAGSMLGAGPQTLEVTFNPTDTAAYGSATTTVTLQVKQATPMITWATPAAVAYGTALSATQLDATASVPGTFVYNPASGVIPSAGNDTLSVTFTPTDAVDYTTATANVTLTVNPNPLPFLGNMTPAIADAGGAAFTITVNGANFLPNSTVYWGTSALATQYVSASQLTATVTAADIAIPGATAINVQTPAPGGGTSDILQFEVDSPAATATAPTVPSTVVSITAGSTATYSISFPAAVTSATATCLNLPAGAICSYSSATKMLTITTASTTPAGTYQVTVVFSETVASTASAGIFLPFLLLPLFFLRKKLTSRGIWSAAFLGLILLATTAFSIGCGGSSSTTSTQSTQSVTSSGVVALTVQ